MQTILKEVKKDKTLTVAIIKQLEAQYLLYMMTDLSVTKTKQMKELKNILPLMKGILSEVQMRCSMEEPSFYEKAMGKIQMFNREGILMVSNQLQPLHCARRSFLKTCLMQPNHNNFCEVSATIEVPSLQELPKEMVLKSSRNKKIIKRID